MDSAQHMLQGSERSLCGGMPKESQMTEAGGLHVPEQHQLHIKTLYPNLPPSFNKVSWKLLTNDACT